MYGCCKNDKIRSPCGRHCGLHDFDALYLLYIVNRQERQIENLLVQLVFCMLNELLAHNLPPYSAPLNCSILCSGSRCSRIPCPPLKIVRPDNVA